MCEENLKDEKNNVKYDESTPVQCPQRVADGQSGKPIENPLDPSIDAAWLEAADLDKNHTRVVAGLKRPRPDDPPGGCAFGTARGRQAAFEDPVPVGRVTQGQE